MAKVILRLTLELSSADFIHGHDPLCSCRIANPGAKPVAIKGPQELALRVIDRATGEEAVFAPKRYGNVARHGPGFDVEIAPGKDIGDCFRLSDRVPSLAPGRYEISAIYTHGPKGASVESAPVAVRVRAATPKGLSLASACGTGDAAAWYGAWVNVASEPPEVVLSQFLFSMGGGASTMRAVAEVPLRSRPVISAPPNGSVAPGHWVAWTAGAELRCVFAGAEGGPSGPRAVELPSGDGEIVFPLLCESPEDDDAKPPAGAALVACGRGGEGGWKLVTVALGADGPRVAGTLAPGGEYPEWIEARVLSNGNRRAFLVQDAGDDFRLSVVDWSGRDKGPAKPKRLASWPGRLVSAGTALDDDDNVLGACLAWIEYENEDGEQTGLKLVRWKVGPDGEFEETAREDVPWTGPVESAVVRVTSDGDTAALMRDEAGAWHVRDPYGKLAPLPGDLARTRLPLDLGFMGPEAVLIAGVKERGFEVLGLDGSALPPRFEP